MSRPRIRTVKPELWPDERVADLSHGARLLFIGLITMADDEGRFRAPASVMLGHVFPFDDEAPRRLRGWVEEIKSTGMVVFYISDGKPYGAFRHWKRHQKINRPVASDLPPPPNRDIVTENSVKHHGQDTEQSGTAPGVVTDEALNGHGVITDDSRSHAQARVPIRSLTTEDVKEEVENDARALCSLLADLIVARDPKLRTKVAPESATWLRDMRRLLQLDDRPRSDVEAVIRWSQADDFWSPNILSPGRLRKQFPVLWGQMRRPARPNGRRANTSDLHRKLRESEAIHGP